MCAFRGSVPHNFKDGEKLFFLTSDEKMKQFDSLTLYPRVPRRRMRDENNYARRVCLGTSIYKILKAVPISWIKDHPEKREFVVFKAVKYNPDLIYDPSDVFVPDVRFTGEIWCKGKVVLEKIGVLQVDDAEQYNVRIKNELRNKILVGTRKNIKWHWIEKPKEKVKII